MVDPPPQQLPSVQRPAEKFWAPHAALPIAKNPNSVFGYAAVAALDISFYQVLPLLAPNLDLISLVSLCKASKQLLNQCLDLPDQLLQSIVRKGLKQKQPKQLLMLRQDPRNARDSCCSCLAWLLGALSKRWGIMQLAARLALRQALLAAEQDSLACYILIRAGARVTRHLILCSGCNGGPKAWASAYSHLGLSWSLPSALVLVLEGLEGVCVRTGINNQLFFELVGAAFKVSNHAVVDTCLRRSRLQRQRGALSSEQILELSLLAARRADSSLLRLLRLSAAQHITSSQYGDLLVMLLRGQYQAYLQDVATLILQHVQWDQQLVKKIAAAVKSQSSSKMQSGKPCLCCKICSILSTIAVSAADLSLQLQISLLCAATSTHGEAAPALLQQVATSSDIRGASEGVAAVAAAIRCWPNAAGSYRRYFKQLLQQPAVQQLPLAEVQQLLLQAVRSSCREGLQCLLKYLPTAQEVTGEGLQQLLGEAVEGTNCSSDQQLVAVLVGCSLPAVQLLGSGDLQLLIMKCLMRDNHRALKCMLCGFKAAAEQLQFAAVCELILQAAALEAHACLLELLQLPQQLEDVPVAVLQQALPMLIKRTCPRYPADAMHGIPCKGSSCCGTCSLLKAVAGKLAAADAWEVLAAAATAPVEHLHWEGQASLPGVDELGDEQVEQLFMTAIEAVGLGREGQPLLRKLEQLQGELLFSRRLSSVAAVHRLMVACVGKAVEGGVGRLREELGLQGEGWERPLVPEQFGQLLKVATRCAIGQYPAVDCRPCLLTLAKLLPSLRVKQLVVEGLWVAQVGLYGLGRDPESEEAIGGAELGSYADNNSQSDSYYDY